PLSLRAQVVIEQDKPSAKANQDRIESKSSALAVYTDGSGIDNKVGAAAITTSQVAHQHLGSNMLFNVYAGELAAINVRCRVLPYQVQGSRVRGTRFKGSRY